jgi:hypothetical protein
VLAEDARHAAVHLVAEPVGQMLVDPAAAYDIQHLRSTANREHRDVPLERGAHQLELELVPLAYHSSGLRMRRGAVEARIEVGSTREHEPVHRVERLLDAGARRHEQRRTARLLDRLDVRGRDERSRESPVRPRGLRQISRDADPGSSHARRIALARSR